MFNLNFRKVNLTAQSEKYAFRDDGFVEDVFMHEIALSRELFGNNEILEDTIKADYATCDGKPRGRCGVFRLDDFTLLAIAYLHHSNKIHEDFLISHEELHAIHFSKNLSLFEEKMRKDRGISIDLSRFYDSDLCSYFQKEFVANLGGIFVVERDYGIIPREIHSTAMEEALSIFLGQTSFSEDML